MPAPRKPPAKAAERPEGAPRVLLFTGPDSSKKLAEAQKRMAEAVDADFADFDAESLDGNGSTAEGILSSVATVPFGTGKKVVLVRDSQQLDLDEQKKLAAGLGQVPGSSLLLLHTGTPILEDGKTKRGSVVALELTNAVKKLGEIVDFGAVKPEDLRGLLIQHARRFGKTVASDALQTLCQLPPEDLPRAFVELEKAGLHAGDSAQISRADVEATLSRSPDDVIFKLCDAVGNRRTPEALDHVSTLFRSGARPDSVAPRVLVMLARQIRLIAQFRFLGENRMAGRNAGPVTPEIQAILPADGAAGMAGNPRQSWMADKYVAQARNFTSAELAERLEAILLADLSLKGIEPGGDDPRAVLQRLVVRLG